MPRHTSSSDDVPHKKGRGLSIVSKRTSLHLVAALMELGDTYTLVSKEALSSRDGPRVAADGMDVLLGVASLWVVSVLP